jgi:hypothetical protein
MDGFDLAQEKVCGSFEKMAERQVAGRTPLPRCDRSAAKTIVQIYHVGSPFKLIPNNVARKEKSRRIAAF